MSKMREQFLINDRLREYIERMLTVIIENNPQLLEVTTSTGVSIGSMGMPSTNHRQQSSPTTTTENKPILSRNLTSADSPSTPTNIKEPADKYCRL